MYDALVLPILTYGAAIWGHRHYSCINAVFNRALRFYLGVGKYTPNAAVQGDMGWKSPWSQQWICIFRNWSRLCDMSEDKLCKRIFLWCSNISLSKKNWIYHVKHYLNSIQMSHLSRTDVKYSNSDMNDLCLVLSEIEEQKWFEQINKEEPRSNYNNGRNKLRTYCLFKSSYVTESYVKCILSRAHRSSFAKFRCGVAPIGIELGRYTNTPLNDRICRQCNSGSIESESHVLLECILYQDIRDSLFVLLSNHIVNFNTLSDKDKLCHILSGDICLKECAKTCHKILQRRRAFTSV